LMEGVKSWAETEHRLTKCAGKRKYSNCYIKGVGNEGKVKTAINREG